MDRLAYRNIFVWMAVLCVFSAMSDGASLSLYTTAGDPAKIMTHTPRPFPGPDGRTQIVMEGDYLSGRTGQPDIPWQPLTVLLPPNADLDSVTLRLEDAQYRAYEGTWQVDPVPPMATRDERGHSVLVWPRDRVIEDGRDKMVYDTNAFWPTEGARVIDSGRLHQWQLAEIAVPLMRYNPVTGQLQELISADVIVDYTRSVGGQGRERAAIGSLRGGDRVRNMAVNYEAAAAAYEVPPAEATFETLEPDDGEEALIGTAGISSKGYVILTTDAIASTSTQLANFVAHKQSCGWNVSVVTETQWGGGVGSVGAVNLREWLRTNYLGLDTLYVLLIGNPHPETGHVPMRWYNDGYESVEGGVLGAPTDALYSDLSSSDSWDKYWEVIVGRIPYYGTMSTLDAILLKTINYENSQAVLWRWRGLLAMVPLADTTPAYQCGEQITNQILIPNEIASTRIYESDYGLSPAPEYLLGNRYPATEWASQPYGLVAWITHGWQSGATDVISTSSVSQLNDQYPSAVYEGSCQNAWPENSSNLAYRILQNGGITTVAATRNSFYTPGQTNYTTGSSIGTLAYHYTKNMAGSRQSCGMALVEAKKNLNLYKANATRMNLFGDPSVTVFVDPDFTPPSPDPMTWDVEPYENGPGSVTMTAATAVDNSDTAVEYYFRCVSGGGRDSGWQSSRVYTDTGVTQLYNVYRVKARDLSDSKNETALSPPAAVTIAPYPYGGQARIIPGRIQAEHFDAGGQGVTYYDTTAGNSSGQLRTREDVDIAAITDGIAGYAVDSVATGEWLLYTVNCTLATVDLYARVASIQDDGQLIVSLDGEILTIINIPNTGALETWQNVMAGDLALPDRPGAQLKIEFRGTGFRLNWIALQKQLPFGGNPSSVPGRIEFENYDIGSQDIAYFDTSPLSNAYNRYRTTEGVEIMDILDGGTNGYGVYADPSEWLEYTCTIPPGLYTVAVRHTSMFTDQQMSLFENEVPAATFILPSTGGWNSWQDTLVQDVLLTGGADSILRFKMDASSALVNHFELIRQYNPADVDFSGWVDLEDFSVLATQWQSAPGIPSADIEPPEGDGVVDLFDLYIFAENWLSY